MRQSWYAVQAERWTCLCPQLGHLLLLLLLAAGCQLCLCRQARGKTGSGGFLGAPFAPGMAQRLRLQMCAIFQRSESSNGGQRSLTLYEHEVSYCPCSYA